MDAVIKGDADNVNAVIAAGVNVNENDEYGWTALQLAAAYGHTQLVNRLLANGADPNMKNTNGRTALMYAAAFGHTSIVKALLTAHADTNAASHDPDDMHTGETALMLAAWSGHSDIIRLLIEAGADVNAKGGPLDGTALHAALWEVFANSIQALLEAPELDLSETDGAGLTAKEASREKGREEIAVMLEESEQSRLAKA
jgi:ankyrin repeat protein